MVFEVGLRLHALVLALEVRESEHVDLAVAAWGGGGGEVILRWLLTGAEDVDIRFLYMCGRVCMCVYTYGSIIVCENK